MSEKIKGVVYLIIFVIAIVGISIFLNYQSRDSKRDVTNQEQSTDIQSYITEVSEQTFENEVLQSDKKVLIDFYATWCMPCRTIKPSINEVAKEHPEIKVVSIDVDKAPNISNQYGIYSLPTLVVLEAGNEVNRVVGAIPKKNIVEILGLK